MDLWREIGLIDLGWGVFIVCCLLLVFVVGVGWVIVVVVCLRGVWDVMDWYGVLFLLLVVFEGCGFFF